MSATITRRIARSTGIISATTAFSRVLGFIRDLIMARLFGTLIEAQAFVVAFRLPNLFRDLVGEGAMASAVVPVLSTYRARNRPEEFWSLSQAVLTQLCVALCLLGALGVVAAPQIVRLIAPGFASDPEKFALTVLLTRILFPFITLAGLWAFFMGLLNTLHHFAVPALGPAILNVAMLAACAWFAPAARPAIIALSVAVLIGGLLQVLIQLPVAARLGFRWGWRWRHPGSPEILRLLGPRMVGSAVYQVNVLVDTALASISSVVGEGAVAVIYFANRFVQLPLALFGSAAAQASLPSLSERAGAEDLPGFGAILSSVLRMVLFVVLPSAAGLVVLSYPIVHGLFEYGAFDARATQMTSQTLAYYALGLGGYSLNKIFTGAFYALRDTRTPVRLAAETVLLNIVLCLALMWPLRVGGLALASAISSTVNAGRLAQRLEQRLGMRLLQPLFDPALRMALASVLMGAACRLAWTLGGLERHPWAGLLFVIGFGVVVYGAACRLLRVQELATAWRWARQIPLVQTFVGE